MHSSSSTKTHFRKGTGSRARTKCSEHAQLRHPPLLASVSTSVKWGRSHRVGEEARCRAVNVRPCLACTERINQLLFHSFRRRWRGCLPAPSVHIKHMEDVPAPVNQRMLDLKPKDEGSEQCAPLLGI